MANKIISWQLTRKLDEDKIPAYEEMLDNLTPSIDISRNQDTGEWILNAFFDEEQAKASIISCVSIADKISGIKNGADITPIYEDDWNEKAKHSFPPIEIGKFFLHSFDEQTPQNMVGLKIPAGLAFGTGEHPTTAGCLTLYESLIKQNTFKNGLDMGAGSGILAMAAAKVQNTKFLAVDIHKESVETCIDNMQTNNVTNKVSCIHGDGFNTKEVQEKQPFDLIFANILMQPLLDMANDFVSVMQEGGVAILSGFLTEQEDEILKRYTSLGLKNTARFEMNNWVALSFVK